MEVYQRSTARLITVSVEDSVVLSEEACFWPRHRDLLCSLRLSQWSSRHGIKDVTHRIAYEECGCHLFKGEVIKPVELNSVGGAKTLHLDSCSELSQKQGGVHYVAARIY